MGNQNSIKTRVVIWNEDRNLLSYGYDSTLEVDMLEEELTEYQDAITIDDKLNALCDLVVVAYGTLAKMKLLHTSTEIDFSHIRLDSLINMFKYSSTTQEASEALGKLIGLCRYKLELLGYIYECCMNETLLEIESRTGEIDGTGKFQKDTSPEARATWYVLDYTKCKA